MYNCPYIPDSRRLIFTLHDNIVGGFKWIQANPDEKVPETKYTVKKLDADQIYEFRIAAENKAGLGPASDPTAPTQVRERVGLYLIYSYLTFISS